MFKKGSFCDIFISKYPKQRYVINHFKNAIGKYPDWNDITDANLRKFREYMEKKVCSTTAKGYFAFIKATVNEYRYEIDVPSRKMSKILSAKQEPSQSIYLTEDELARFEQYPAKTIHDHNVKKVFLIECYTGCRSSDAKRITRANISNGVLSYVPEKTSNLVVSMPLHPVLDKYIDEHTTEHLTPPTFNTKLKAICKKIGMTDIVELFRKGERTTGHRYEFVSSHTGRRTFATNLYLRGADLLSISRLMGHTSEEMTRRYIVGYRELSDNVMDFFKDENRTE